MSYSLRALAVAVIFVGLACAGFVTGDGRWATAVSLITLGTGVYAVIQTLFGPIDDRAYWGSYTIRLGAYLAFASVQFHAVQMHQVWQPVHRALAPLQARRLADPGFEIRKTDDNNYQIGPNRYYSSGVSFFGTVQLLNNSVALIVALVAARVGVRASRRRHESAPPPVS